MIWNNMTMWLLVLNSFLFYSCKRGHCVYSVQQIDRYSVCQYFSLTLKFFPGININRYLHVLTDWLKLLAVMTWDPIKYVHRHSLHLLSIFNVLFNLLRFLFLNESATFVIMAYFFLSINESRKNYICIEDWAPKIVWKIMNEEKNIDFFPFHLFLQIG